MSLINEMLRDLDNRSPFPIENREVKVEPKGQTSNLFQSRRSLFVFAGLIIGVFGIGLYRGIYLSNLSINRPSIEASPHAKSQLDKSAEVYPSKMLSKSPLLKEKVVINVVSEKVPTAPIEKSKQHTAEKDLELNSITTEESVDPTKKLLQVASSALMNNRLTLPEGESAFDFYREVLSYDPVNTAARDGLEILNLRYCELIEKVLALQDVVRAQKMLARAKKVGLNLDADTVNDFNRSIRTILVAVEKNNASRENENIDSFAKVKVEQVEQQSKYNVETQEVNLDRRHLSITKTDRYRENDVVQSANNLLDSNRPLEAQELLANYLDSHAEASVVRLSLFELYLNKSEIIKAQALTRFPEAKNSAALAYMNAMFQLKAGDSTSAIEILESVTPKDELFERYNGLLAGLYQKEKSYNNAARLYRALIKVNSENANYWLGFAVSADALDESNVALNAYRVAINYRGLESQVLTYIQQRIDALATKERMEISAW